MRKLELAEIQQIELEIFDAFVRLCKQHGLSYQLAYGSLLGAVRHQGFIPWDDDIDVVLPRPDYDRLLSTFTEKTDHYLLESPYTGNADYYYTYAKLYDTDTTLTEKTKRNCRRGIYIDVFPLDGIGRDEGEMEANFAKIDRLNMFLMTRTCAIRKDRSFYKNAAIALSRLVPSFLVKDRELVVKVDKLAASFAYTHVAQRAVTSV